MADNNQITLYRNELKYFITFIDYLKIKDILANFLRLDEYSDSGNGYWIRSLYFDTPDDKEYIERILKILETKPSFHNNNEEENSYDKKKN